MCKFRYTGNNLTPQINLSGRTILPKNGVFVMGIINTTPDSFFSGSRKTNPDDAVQTALKMVQDGADILDLGAESTRPGAMYVSEDEQIKRMLPVLQAIRKKTDCPVSIDTRSLKVFQTMFDNGADILNDISALEDDDKLAPFAAEQKIPVILMHKKGNPDEMMSNLCYNNIVTDIVSYFKERIDYAHSQGIEDSRIIIDPGLGFSKNLAQNIEIISRTFDFSF
jgi:dihydropteroate synthase